ncbi:MAG: hypothetical protein ACE5KM_03610 [Planctomycetaceae bacterium]
MALFSTLRKRNDTADIGRYMRRIRDLTIPNYGNHVSQDRREDRHNRAIPMLMCPWQDGKPVESESLIVVTKDVCNLGIGLLLCQPVHSKYVVVGLHPDTNDPSQPWFFLGQTCHLTALGGGFWTMGLELTEFANAEFAREIEMLRPLMAKLRPRSAAALTTV